METEQQSLYYSNGGVRKTSSHDMRDLAKCKQKTGSIRKPTYSKMITAAILSSRYKMIRLEDIYEYISRNFPHVVNQSNSNSVPPFLIQL